MQGLLHDTLSEMISRKLPFMYGLLLLVTIIVLLGLRGADWHLRVDGVEDSDMVSMVRNVPLHAIMTFTWFVMLLSLFASSGSLASLYTSGRVDFYLSKPLSRTRLLLGKLGSTWIVYGAALTVSAAVVIAATGIFFGTFEPRVFISLGLFLFVFLIYLSVAALVGAATGSQSLTYLALFLFWLAQSLLSERAIAEAIVKSKIVRGALDVCYYVLPKPGEIGELASQYLLTGEFADWTPVWTSALALIAILVGAIALLRRREF